MPYDNIVIAGYFAVTIAVAIVFRRMGNNSTSDYFHGGSRMLR
ncbi:MAG: hypothetical protein ABJ275_04810 [Maricaulaceae bacterium]